MWVQGKGAVRPPQAQADQNAGCMTAFLPGSQGIFHPASGMEGGDEAPNGALPGVAAAKGGKSKAEGVGIRLGRWHQAAEILSQPHEWDFFK